MSEEFDVLVVWLEYAPRAAGRARAGAVARARSGVPPGRGSARPHHARAAGASTARALPTAAPSVPHPASVSQHHHVTKVTQCTN